MLRRRALPLAVVGLFSFVVAACNSPTANEQLASLLSSSARCERPPGGAAPTGRGHPALTGHATVPLAGMPFAVAVSGKGGVYVINTATRQVIDSIPSSATGSLLTGVAFHPLAPCMYIAARDEGAIRTVDLREDSVVHTDAVSGARIQNVAVSLDGRLLFATDIQRSKLLVRDLTTEGSTFLEYAIGSGQVRNAFDVAVTPDNSQVYVSTLADGKVYVLDRATRALVDSIVTGGSARYIGFSRTGAHAVIANEMGWVDFLYDDPHAASPVCLRPPAGTAPAGFRHPGLSRRALVWLGGPPLAVPVSPACGVYVKPALAASR